MVRFPRHPRYGDQAGRDNPFFLDPAYAADEVIGPARQGLGDKLGVVLFQFPPQQLAAISGRGKFPARLHAFLSALPPGPTYAIEIRNHQLFTPRYLRALRDVGAVHCLSGHPSMHELAHQVKSVDPLRDAAIVVRWMLSPRFGYQEARQRYAPFDRIINPDPQARDTIATLCREAATLDIPVYVIANNKAEGCAPLSLTALAKQIVVGAT
jgi:uncharacterized protein YecE (DUF72 family)